MIRTWNYWCTCANLFKFYGQEEFHLALLRNSHKQNLFADRVCIFCIALYSLFPFSTIVVSCHLVYLSFFSCQLFITYNFSFKCILNWLKRKVVSVYQRNPTCQFPGIQSEFRITNGSKNVFIVKQMIKNFIIHCSLLSIIRLIVNCLTLYITNFSQLILSYMHAYTITYCRYLICLMSSIKGLLNLKNLFGL